MQIRFSALDDYPATDKDVYRKAGEYNSSYVQASAVASAQCEFVRAGYQ